MACPSPCRSEDSVALPPLPLSFVADVISRVAAAQRAAAAAAVAAGDGATVDSGRTDGRTDADGRTNGGGGRTRCSSTGRTNSTVDWSTPHIFGYHLYKINMRKGFNTKRTVQFSHNH